MPYIMKRGKDLSKSKVNDTIKLLTPTQRTEIINQNWECIPDGPNANFTDEQKLAFIIAAAPMAGDYSAKFIADTFIAEIAITIPNPKDYPNNKPALYHRLQEYCPEVLAAMIKAYRPHKHVYDDIKANDMWVGLTALANMIDSMRVQLFSQVHHGGFLPNDIAVSMSYNDPEVNEQLEEILSNNDKLKDAVQKFTEQI